jgi:predicted esterase
VRVLNIETTTHGRVLIEDPAGSFSGLMIVGCHGYGQAADTMLEELRKIPGSDAWRLVSVQALHRFYTRNDQSVVANWMTRQDRDAAIADNIQYLDRAVEAARTDDVRAIVFLGFSQGASMAVRAAVCGRHRAAGLIMMGGDIPSDVREATSRPFPPTLIGVGSRDQWYAGERAEEDIKLLEDRGVRHQVVRFEGGHEFTQEFRVAAGRWVQTLMHATSPSIT